MPGSMMQPDLSGVTATGGTRAAALARWQDNGWPGPRVEAWRYTSLAKLSDLEIAPLASLARSASGPGMAAFPFKDARAGNPVTEVPLQGESCRRRFDTAWLPGCGRTDQESPLLSWVGLALGFGLGAKIRTQQAPMITINRQ